MTAGVAYAQQVTVDSLLHDLYDLSSLPILDDSRCRQFSSYDRTGANSDAGNYLSEKDGNALLAEMKGPGAIVRIWSANPSGRLKIYLDDQPQPAIDMPFAELFSDAAYQPLRTPSSGGFVSYFPIPYQGSCRVVVEQGDGFYYHVTYQTYGPNAQVQTYTKTLTSTGKRELANVLAAWRSLPTASPSASPNALGPVAKMNSSNLRYTIPSGRKKSVFEAKGPASIDSLHLALTGSQRALKQSVIRIYWDDEKSPSVEAPICDFFGCGFGYVKFASLALGMQDDGCYCRFPMPFAESARIEVENGSSADVGLSLDVSWRQLGSLNPAAGYFHAKWNHEFTKQGVPYTILSAKGRGRFVGDNLSMQGGDGGLGFLEGDELIYVDGEKTPSFNGTGTEDYFNSGWYFSGGLNAMALNGDIVRSDQEKRVSAYRMQIPDYVSFDKELKVRIEHGGMNDYPDAEYSSVAYFYQVEPHTDFFRMPRAKDLEYPRLVAPGMPSVNEVEKLGPTASGGKLSRTSWAKLTDVWRGSDVVVLTPEKPGASLSFNLRADMRDRYAIAGLMVDGPEFGASQLLVDGKPIGDPYVAKKGAATSPSGPVNLGVCVLDRGRHRFTLQAVGQSGKIGIDGIRIDARPRPIDAWLVSGSYPQKDPMDLDTPYAPETTPKSIEWKAVNGENVANLFSFMEPQSYAVVYGLVYVTSPEERDARLYLGSDDAIKVWLNDQVVWQRKVLRGLGLYDDAVNVHLKKGLNKVLLKVTQGNGGWGFAAAISDPESVLSFGTSPN